MINGRVSPEGAIFGLKQDAPDGALTVGGQAMSNLGVLYVGNVGPMGSVALDPMTLFANGEAGDFWDDTARASMFSDLAMTTPAVIEGLVAAQVGRANGIVASSAPGQEPTLSARYNWLVSSENYNDIVAWNTTGDVIVTGQQLDFSTDSAYFYNLLQKTVKAGQTIKAKVKISGPAGSQIVFRIAPIINGIDDAQMLIDLSPTPTIYELDLTPLADDTGFFIGLDVRNIPNIPGPALPVVVVADGFSLTDDINVAYQRTGNTLVDPADYDSEGFNSYLVWSGAQAQVTPVVDFSGTDKATIFAGATMPAPGGFLIVIELGDRNIALPGSFSLCSPGNGDSFYTGFNSNPNIIEANTISYPPPVAAALAAAFDGAATTKETQNILWVDGVKFPGNLGLPVTVPAIATAALNFGARTQAALWYIGKTVCRIVRGAASTQAEIDGVSQYISMLMGGTAYSTPNSYLTDQNGTLMIGPPPIVGYKGGYPYNADNELVVQLNQPPVPGDAWVGGIRVGPAGGVYIIDTTPPPDDGFDSGFSNGYGA